MSIAADVPATGAGISAGAVRSLGELVASLAAPEFATREAATRELATRSDIKQTDLEDALSSPGLTPEQRSRLILANRDKFARTPRAALGVEFIQDFNTPDRAVIARTRAGFPAGDTGELLAGDEILSINGKEAGPEIARQVFRPMIIAREPGEILKTKIRRDGQVISQDVHVGRYDDLYAASMNPARNSDIAYAWRARSEDYPIASKNTIPSPLPFEIWASAADAARALDEMRSDASSIMARHVMSGGQTRGVLPVTAGMLNSDDQDVRLAGFNGNMVWPGRAGADEQAILQIRPGNRLGLGTANGFAMSGQPDPFANSLQVFTLERERAKRMMTIQQDIAIDPTNDEATRKKAKLEMLKYAERVQTLDRQINDLRRAMNQRVPAPRVMPR